MLKKIISLFLCLFMIAASVPSVHAYEATAYQDPPSLPVTAFEVSDTYITVSPIDEQNHTRPEFSIDEGLTWTVNRLFQNLSPATYYIFYARFSESNQFAASDPVGPFVIKTTKSQNFSVSQLEIESRSYTKITLKKIEGCEYSLDRENWQRSNVFTALTPNTTYYFYARYYETATRFAGEPSLPIIVTTIKTDMTPPAAPMLAAKSYNTVILETYDGCEYSADLKDWKEQPIFYNLEPNTEYRFYQRFKETDITATSGPSEALIVVTDPLNITSEPPAPILIGKTDTTVTLLEYEGCEYSKDGINWQSDCVFTGLIPNTVYYFCMRYAAIGMIGASNAGTPRIIRTDKTIPDAPSEPVLVYKTDTVVTLLPYEGCEFSINGTIWQEDNVFSGLEPNTPYNFYMRYSATNLSEPSHASEPLAAMTDRSTPEPPSVPELISKSDREITVFAENGVEYSIDGYSWTDTGVFSSLTPNTTYSVIARFKETENAYAGKSSRSLKVTTDRTKPDAPAAPVIVSLTDTTVTLDQYAEMEYSKGGLEWQSSGTFTDLTPNMQYNFYARYAATANNMPSAKSEVLSVKTKKSEKAAPSSPTVYSITKESVTLVGEEGCEYSIDGLNWQAETAFTGLSAGMNYTFYQRYAETETCYSSLPSAGITVSTAKTDREAPPAPVLSAKTASSISVQYTENCEYSIDGVHWQERTVFNGLAPNHTYNVFQRYIETASEEASRMSEPLTVTTNKTTPSRPAAPKLDNKTASTVTLVPVEGCEYSIGGTVWQSDNVFTGLKPKTAYKFYQRYAETETQTQSTSGPALNVMTNEKAEILPPEAPVLAEITPVLLIVNKTEGCEYSINGSEWQNEPVFNGLMPNTVYYIIQRFYATDETLVSDQSEPLIVTTPKFEADIPSAPDLEIIGCDYIVLKEEEGMEYSIDGYDWQTGGTFVSLMSNTEYTFYQRYAETETTYQSEKSAPLTVKTIASVQTSITSDTLEIDTVNKLIKRVFAGTRVAELISAINGGAELKAFDQNGKVEDTAMVYSGMMIKLFYDEKPLSVYTVIVFGDVNRDGNADTSDASLILAFDACVTDGANAELRAGDINGDGDVDALDALLLLKSDSGAISLTDIKNA